jgi:hypothetical protein
MWFEMVWGSETNKTFFFLGGRPSAWCTVAGWQPSAAPWFDLAAQQAVSISWKALPIKKTICKGGSCKKLDADFGSWTHDFASLDCTAWIQPRQQAHD